MVIDALTGAQRRGLAAKLVRVGLAIETRTASGSIIEDIPSKIITLTDPGVSLVEKQLAESDLLDYQINPYKINQSLLRHDLLAQRATLKKLQSGSITDYKTPQELAAKSQAGQKQPDVMWITKNLARIAVEVELTAKFQRKLDDFVWGIVLGLSTVNNRPPLFDRCLIATDSQAILKRYRDAFKPGATVQRWKKDAQSRWTIDRTVQVPDHIQEQLMWELIK